jgi:TolB-like protein/class 3 adenylate cyclase/Tfp pilus assembly protein PilF
MGNHTEHRKLAAIMFTDMVGFSALAQRNEALALELLEEHRRIVRDVLPRHGGREVKTAGDGFLIEFPSALAAVQAAVAIQDAFHAQNQVSPPERQVRIRIGIHVGDVVVSEGDIHGDGVNIAARIEPLAPPGGICVSNAVFEQVRNKLEQPIAALGPAELKNIELPVVVHRVLMPWENGPARLGRPRRQAGVRGWKVAAAVVLALAALLDLWQPWKKPQAISPLARPASTEAQRLTQQARALIDDNPLALRENYRLAEELGRRAVQLDPTDGEAWATLARATVELLTGRYDTSTALRESARSQVDRALSLAPDSAEAGLAMADYLVFSQQQAVAEKRLRALLVHFPSDRRVVKLLAESVWDQGRTDESMQTLRDHANLPGGKAALLSHEAYSYFDEAKLVEADALLDQIFADKPNAHDYLTRLLVLWHGWGDLKAAGDFLEKMPPQLLQEDAFVNHACAVWTDLGETEKALDVLRRTPRDFLEEWRVIVPKGLLAGRVLQAAGRTEAAQVEWHQALALVEQRLAAEPNRADWVGLKATLLGLLGQKAEGEKQLKLWLELSGIRAADQAARSIGVQMALGNHEAAIQGFQDYFNRKLKRWPGSLESLRYDPLYAPLRSDPRIQQLIALGEGWLQDMRDAEARKQAANAPNASPVDPKSVAVLPFVNMSPDKDNEYFSDGISEEILNALARTPGLRVAARTSAFSFKGKNESVQMIGTALNVGAVLEGSVRKAGNQLRITTQLINVANGFHLWSEEYDRDMTNVFAIQSDIAARVASALKVQLLGAAAQLRQPTENIQAYQLYLRARQLWNRREPATLEEAIGLFNQAIAADPTFALAYSGLADCYIVSSYTNVTPSDCALRARAAALKAIELDASLGEPHAALAMIQALHDWDWSGSEAQFHRAMELNPNYATAHHWLGLVYEAQGRCGEAVAELQRAQALDPLSSIINSRTGLTLCMCGNVEPGIQLLQRHLALEPNWYRAHTSLALCYFQQGKLAEAIQELEAAQRLSGMPIAQLGFLYARAGRTNDALEVSRQLSQNQPAGQPDDAGIALIEHGLGNDAKALDLLERAPVREGELPWLAISPQWKDLRPQPRFQAILRRMNLAK